MDEQSGMRRPTESGRRNSNSTLAVIAVTADVSAVVAVVTSGTSTIVTVLGIVTVLLGTYWLARQWGRPLDLRGVLAVITIVSGAVALTVVTDRAVVGHVGTSGGGTTAPADHDKGSTSHSSRPSPPASSSASPTSGTGPLPLSALTAVGSFGKWRDKAVTVNSTEYSNAMTVTMCYQEGWRQFQFDRRNGRLKAKIGLTDDSSGVRITFRVLRDGERIYQKSIGVGETADVDIDVTDAFRVTITAYFEDVCFDTGPDVTAVWIDPRIE